MKDQVHTNEMIHEENRLASFGGKWRFPDSSQCSAKKLAEAGFYFLEKPDAVMCFVCLKKLEGWESKDDPWKEHLSHSQNCLFAKTGKTEGNLKLSEYLDVVKSRFINIVLQEMKVQRQNIEAKYDKVLTDLSNLQ